MDEFRTALRNVVQTACEAIANLDGVPMARRSILKVTENGCLHRVPTDVVIVSHLAHMLGDEVFDHPCVQTLLEAARAIPAIGDRVLVDGIGATFASDVQKSGLVHQSLVVPFLAAYFAQAGALEFVDAAFDETYEELLLDMSPVTHPVVEVSPLANLKLATNEIPVCDGVRIVKAPIRDKEDFLDVFEASGKCMSPSVFLTGTCCMTSDRPLFPFQAAGGIDAYLERIVDVPHAEPPTVPASPEDNQLILDLLRLYTSDDVQLVFTRTGHYRILHGPQMSVHWPPPSETPGRDTVTTPLDEPAASELKCMWSSLAHGANSSVARLALSRYGTGTGRRRVEDQIIDYWIALESIFLQENDELRFRASLRIAGFLGITGDERVHIRRQAMNSYDVRSKVVHGSSRLNENQITVACSETRELLRTSLIKLLRSTERFDPRTIEDMILRSV
ncbi:MAG: HEPN domain-containing protein [Clostridia bacterium]|nr:HEPN domain-containing protein [Clostridia bacterium]